MTGGGRGASSHESIHQTHTRTHRPSLTEPPPVSVYYARGALSEATGLPLSAARRRYMSTHADRIDRPTDRLARPLACPCGTPRDLLAVPSHLDNDTRLCPTRLDSTRLDPSFPAGRDWAWCGCPDGSGVSRSLACLAGQAEVFQRGCRLGWFQVWSMDGWIDGCMHGGREVGSIAL